jgi:hypothetical protein
MKISSMKFGNLYLHKFQFKPENSDFVTRAHPLDKGRQRRQACAVPHCEKRAHAVPLPANRGGALRLVGKQPGGGRRGQHVVARFLALKSRTAPASI